jgi:hypothetical protein
MVAILFFPHSHLPSFLIKSYARSPSLASSRADVVEVTSRGSVRLAEYQCGRCQHLLLAVAILFSLPVFTDARGSRPLRGSGAQTQNGAPGLKHKTGLGALEGLRGPHPQHAARHHIHMIKIFQKTNLHDTHTPK